MYIENMKKSKTWYNEKDWKGLSMTSLKERIQSRGITSQKTWMMGGQVDSRD